jgi:hypothetical protein
MHAKFLWRNLLESNHLGDQEEGNITLRYPREIDLILVVLNSMSTKE